MPPTKLVYYREEDGTVPIVEWLAGLPRQAIAKSLTYLARLELNGHELRRPAADYLRDGIYELRIRYRNVNYRLLYFFAGRRVVVISHGLTKERRVPANDVALAEKRRRAFLDDPRKHTFLPE